MEKRGVERRRENGDKKKVGDVVDELCSMVESERVGDSCGDGYGTSVCRPAVSLCVLVVTGVLVSFSVVRVFGEDFLSSSNCELTESQYFSLSRKSRDFLMEGQGGMSMENSLAEVPPTTRRNIQEVGCGVDHGWTAVYQTVAKRMLDYLNKSEVLKVNECSRVGISCAGTERAEYRHRAHCEASKR